MFPVAQFRDAVNMPDLEVVGTRHTHPKDPARPSNGDKFVQTGMTGDTFGGLPPPISQSVDKGWRPIPPYAELLNVHPGKTAGSTLKRQACRGQQ